MAAVLVNIKCIDGLWFNNYFRLTQWSDNKTQTYVFENHYIVNLVALQPSISNQREQEDLSDFLFSNFLCNHTWKRQYSRSYSTAVDIDLCLCWFCQTCPDHEMMIWSAGLSVSFFTRCWQWWASSAVCQLKRGRRRRDLANFMALQWVMKRPGKH